MMTPLEITAYFVDEHERGTITRTVEKLRPVREYRRVPQLSWLGSGGGFTSQDSAREAVDTAVRTIHFMDTAALVPSGAWVSLFGHDNPGCHGFDHTQVWFWHDKSKLVTTEPYGRHEVAKVLDWCRAHDWEAREFPEWGMWNPPHTTLILCAPRQSWRAFWVVFERLKAFQPIPLDAREQQGLILLRPRAFGRQS